jgi:hypothetical protein
VRGKIGRIAGGWYGAEERDGYYDYADAIPIQFTPLDRLQTSRPRDAAWWRYGDTASGKTAQAARAVRPAA